MSIKTNKKFLKIVNMKTDEIEKKSLGEIFGRRLAYLRRNRQMSQAQLAEDLGVSRSVIAYYESSAKNPTLEAVQKVSDFFEVPPEYLIIEDSEQPKKSGPTSRLDLQIQRIRRLSPHRQRKVSDLIDIELNSK